MRRRLFAVLGLGSLSSPRRKDARARFGGGLQGAWAFRICPIAA